MSGPQAGAGAGGTGQRCPGCAQVAAALEGRDPSLIAVLPHAVLVLGPAGARLGQGLSAYGSGDAGLIAGQRSDRIEAILGWRGRDEVIHRDDLVLF